MANDGTDLVPSGIDGLDKLLEGGFPRGASVILEGPPGTGKTIMAFQFLADGNARHGERGIYLTLEETPHSLRRNMKRFGMDLEKLENSGSLLILDFSEYHGMPVQMGESGEGSDFLVKAIARSITEKVPAISAKRLVLDSLTAVLDHYPPSRRRLEFLYLLSVFRKIGLTSLLIAEVPGREQPHVVQMYLADGNVKLKLAPAGSQGEMVRAIHIPKMRGVKHDFEVHPYQIADRGIVVFPDDRVYAGS